MTRGKFQSKRCSRKKCVKKMNTKAKTLSMEKLGGVKMKGVRSTKNRFNPHEKKKFKRKTVKKSSDKRLKKDEKKGGWVSTVIGTGIGVATGYVVGAYGDEIKNKFSKSDSSEVIVDETVGVVGNDGFNREGNTSGGKKTKSKGKKTKTKGKKTKGKKTKGKKSAYSQFLSTELRRVGDANPDWPQPKVFKEAVSNWSKSK